MAGAAVAAAVVIRFIIIDDLGRADLGFSNNNQIHTPEIDRYDTLV